MLQARDQETRIKLTIPIQRIVKRLSYQHIAECSPLIAMLREWASPADRGGSIGLGDM